MACADVATAKAKEATAINLIIVSSHMNLQEEIFWENGLTQHTYNQFQRPLADRRNYVGHTSANKKSAPTPMLGWDARYAFTRCRGEIPAPSGPHLRLDWGTTDENDVDCN